MTADRGATLLAIARGAIARELGEPPPPFDQADWLDEPGNTFVTLNVHGELRGCMGSLVARRPLREDVEANARVAAFQDSRFTPLSRGEYGHLEVEVSLLSPLEKITFASQADLLAQLRPGVDGLALEYRWWRGTFLPQVWEHLPDPRKFLDHLKLKAGLPAEFWAEDIQVARYTVLKWRERELLAGWR